MIVKPSTGGRIVSTTDYGPVPEPPRPEDMQLTDVLQAMGDPRRLAMLRILADDDWHPCGVETWGLDIQKATVSHHLKTLRLAGLVEYRQHGRQRDSRLRREVVETRFPGLLEGVLSQR